MSAIASSAIPPVEVDLSDNAIGGKYAVEAVCAMLQWKAAGVTSLNLRC